MTLPSENNGFSFDFQPLNENIEYIAPAAGTFRQWHQHLQTKLHDTCPHFTLTKVHTSCALEGSGDACVVTAKMNGNKVLFKADEVALKSATGFRMDFTAWTTCEHAAKTVGPYEQHLSIIIHIKYGFNIDHWSASRPSGRLQDSRSPSDFHEIAHKEKCSMPNLRISVALCILLFPVFMLYLIFSPTFWGYLIVIVALLVLRSRLF